MVWAVILDIDLGSHTAQLMGIPLKVWSSTVRSHLGIARGTESREQGVSERNSRTGLHVEREKLHHDGVHVVIIEAMQWSRNASSNVLCMCQLSRHMHLKGGLLWPVPLLPSPGEY